MCILLGCDYLEPCKGIGPKTALKLLREHGGLGNVVKFVRGKMAEKAEENAVAKAEAEESEVESERESEEGGEPPSSPVKSVKSPAKKKKKVTSAGMQIPEHWPWEEAKKLFITPDVVKGDELEVGWRSEYSAARANNQVEWKAPDVDGLVDFLCRDKGFK